MLHSDSVPRFGVKSGGGKAVANAVRRQIGR
jgi:hypothetical protein